MKRDNGALYTPTGNDDAIDAVDAVKRARVVDNVRLTAGAGTSARAACSGATTRSRRT